MLVSQPIGASVRSRAGAHWRRQLPATLALLPAAIIVVAIYIGAMIWTVRLAFSSSKMLPVFDFVGLQQFERLFATERFVASGWHILVFGVLFIAGALVLGFLLAVFIDQHVRFEGAF
jgi:glucose/mannose transport system permease protein